MPVKEVCRKHGLSEATYYNWKPKYGGMEASDMKRMRELERELSQPKRMCADPALENRALKDLNAEVEGLRETYIIPRQGGGDAGRRVFRKTSNISLIL